MVPMDILVRRRAEVERQSRVYASLSLRQFLSILVHIYPCPKTKKGTEVVPFLHKIMDLPL